ncbi:hypothetical protein [Thiocystis violacea]|uniref:hypothetical protein n=1 Tax=Thiocystis violacea TaxID=13725 RepID=UPI0019044DDD|nr:hypothetical protein [Thiocystis violacea]
MAAAADSTHCAANEGAIRGPATAANNAAHDGTTDCARDRPSRTPTGLRITGQDGELCFLTVS